MNRRTFLTAAGATYAATLAGADPASFPIIDTHLHLYDATRPQGAPFPKTPNPPPFLPSDYREAAAPLGIKGGIVVEASPWVEDNLWVLMTIEKEPIMVGLVGCLDPTKPEFREYLERYHRNKLFLGIRYGNVWEGHNIVAAVDNPAFIENMKAFAQTGLTFEVANPRFDLIDATVRLTDKVPDLRVMLGHLQALPLPADPAVMKTYSNNLHELRRRKIYAKVSGLPRKNPQADFDLRSAIPCWTSYGISLARTISFTRAGTRQLWTFFAPILWTRAVRPPKNSSGKTPYRPSNG